MNSLTGESLVERTTGGKGGGATRLTERGKQLIANFRLIEEEHKRFIQQLSSQAQGLVEDLILIRRLSMKTSARNQFLGKVTAIKPGAVNDEIDIEIPGGERLVATITSESTKTLELSVGAEVYALVKAPSVMVMSPNAQLRLSARNQLEGKVARLHPGAVNTEVVIELPGGAVITAIVTNESASNLGLDIGVAATAVFKASSVILGVPA
jgi:molybdate transport system regulatory protein